MDQHQLVTQFWDLAQACASTFAEVGQRVIIVAADLLLIVFALIAFVGDRAHRCDEPLKLYGFMCVVLCVVDLAWELVRCTLESALDRLQTETSDSSVGSSLVFQGIEEGLVGQPRVDPQNSSSRSRDSEASSASLRDGVRSLKKQKQKRSSDLHFWSVVFTCLVSLVFSFFAAHDEDCNLRSPALYNYIHTFTYFFICRLLAIYLAICCRTLKDYEDAGKEAGSMAQQPPIALMRI